MSLATNGIGVVCMAIRFFVFFVILVAILLSLFSYLSPHLFSYIAPQTQVKTLVAFHNFFDITLPILAFGALVKYLCTFCD